MATGGYNDMPEKTSDFLCTTCINEGDHSNSVEYCMECSEYYCASCLTFHNSHQPTRAHRKKLLGRKQFGDMTKARRQHASSLPHTSDDFIFSCHTCASGGIYKPSVDYCKKCEEYLCNICLTGHNKWTKHRDKLMGNVDLGKMKDARKTVPNRNGSTTQSCSSTAEERTLSRNTTHTSTAEERTLSRNTTHTSTAEERTLSRNTTHTSHGEVGGVTVPKQSRKPTPPRNSQVDGAKLHPGNMAIPMNNIEKVTIRESGDTVECYGRGICSMLDGGWLVTDTSNKALKRLDASGSVIDRCPVNGYPWDVCFIKENNVVAVTTGGDNIKLISLRGLKMMRFRTIRTKHYCYSVTYAHNKLYVTSQEQELYEHGYSNGRLVRTISPRDSRGEKRFSVTLDIVSSEDGSRLFLTDADRGLFIIDTRTADVIQQVDVGLWPRGVCLGGNEALFVATSDGIYHFNQNGKRLGTAVTLDTMGGCWPWYISYDKRTAKLAVTMDEQCDYILVLHYKIENTTR